MLKLTKTGIGLLTRQYRSVLRKCWLINVGLWQAMGDAVSKAVSVSARLVASLLSGGTMSGEAFNVLDEILLSRLFERKLSSLTAIGLTIAAATMPTEALAITPDEVMAEMNAKSSETHVTWTSYATSGTESYNTSNHTGVKKIKVGGTDYYFSYTFNTTGAGSRAGQNTRASNAYYDGYGWTSIIQEGGAINNSASGVTLENDYFVGNKASFGGAIDNTGTINTLTGNFSGNSAIEGGAIWNPGTINTLTGNFSGNSTSGQGGAIQNYATITTLRGDFSGNSSRIGGAIHNDSGAITTLTGDFSGNSSGSKGGAIYNLNGTIGLLAKDKNISFYNNTDQNGYNDIYQANTGTGKYISLAAASGRQISFGGSIDGEATRLANNVLNIGTDTTSGNYGGQYIFNNAVKNNSLFLGAGSNGANVVLGSIVQADGSTTYGKLEDDNLTVDGTGSVINMANGHVDANTLNTLTLNTNLGLGIDLQHPTSGTTGSADKITYTSGSGSIIIDAINEIGGVAGRPTATGTFTYQILDGSGVTLALDTALKNAWASRKITTGSTTPDTIAATTNWGTTYYYRTPYEIINGTLNASDNNLVYTVSSINPGEDLEKMGDTLALVTTATNNASRIFSTTDATAEYLLSTNLGAVNAVYKNLSINGTVSGNNRSTLNLGNYNGFVLDSSDDNLSLSSMKVSGGNEYSVNLANSGSNLNVANVIMDSTAAPIMGSGNATFTGTNEINTKVLNTGTTTVSSGTTDFNNEVAGFTVSAPATVSIAADDITAETTNNGTLELEGGTNIDTPKILSSRLLGAGKLRIMNSVMLGAGNSATTGQLYFGSSSDYADSILTSSSADSTSDHALVTAGYLVNNYTKTSNLATVATTGSYSDLTGTPTIGEALLRITSGGTETSFSANATADVTLNLDNNYYRKLVKKDEIFDTNKGIMDVKSLKKGTILSKERIIKGVSAFPSIMCVYPFDMPIVANKNESANDNHKSIILAQTACCYAVDARISANDNHKTVITRLDRVISANDNDSAEILWSSHRMTNYFNKQAA